MKGFIEICKKSYYIFNHRQRIRLVFLVLASVAEVLFELSGVVSVYPLIALMMNPGLITDNSLLHAVYLFLGCRSNESFFILVAVGIILLYVVKNVVNAATGWLRYSFVSSTKTELSSGMMREYMGEDYSFFLANNSASLMTKIGTDVSTFCDMMLQVLYFFSDSLVILVFGPYLFYTDFLLSSVSFIVMLLFVLVFVRWNKSRAMLYGKKSQDGAVKMTQWLQQAFGGIKEIKLLGREEYFVNKFESYSGIANRSMRNFSFLNLIPHIVLECVCVAAILSVIIFKITQGTDTDRFIPQMAVFAMALFRIFPRVSRLNQSVNTMIFSYPYLNNVYAAMKLAERHTPAVRHAGSTGRGELAFSNEIKMEHVSYRYPGTPVDVLSDISLTIRKGQAVGLIGPSGSGKSTLADVFLGILKADKGHILCDEKDVSESPGPWSKKFGYIPQSIFLSEDSIRNNIAFGVDVGTEEDGKIWRALEQAQLADFVRSLPDGLDTIVGERNRKGAVRQSRNPRAGRSDFRARQRDGAGSDGLDRGPPWTQDHDNHCPPDHDGTELRHDSQG